MYNSRLYTGKLIIHSTIDIRHPSCTLRAMSCHVMQGKISRGHHVFTDNYNSSPALFAELRDLGFGACGTVRINRRGLPAEIKAKGGITSALVDETMMANEWTRGQCLCSP